MRSPAKLEPIKKILQRQIENTRKKIFSVLHYESRRQKFLLVLLTFLLLLALKRRNYYLFFSSNCKKEKPLTKLYLPMSKTEPVAIEPTRAVSPSPI